MGLYLIPLEFTFFNKIYRNKNLIQGHRKNNAEITNLYYANKETYRDINLVRRYSEKYQVLCQFQYLSICVPLVA